MGWSCIVIMAMTLGSAGSILTAEDNGVGSIGYGTNYGTLTRNPAGVIAQGTSIYTLTVGVDDLNLFLTGDQTPWLTGKSLFLNSTEYTVASADTVSYSSGTGRTTVEWENTAAMTDGSTYIVRIE